MTGSYYDSNDAEAFAPHISWRVTDLWVTIAGYGFVMAEQTPFIELNGVRVADDGVSQIHGVHKLLFVPRHEIGSMSIRHGLLSEHPMIQTFLGVALLFIGVYPVPHLVRWLLTGGKASDLEIIVLMLIPIGIWLVRDAWKRGTYLFVLGDRGTHKLHFRGVPERKWLQEFCRQALLFNYSVEFLLEEES